MTSPSLTPLSTLLAARGDSADFPLQALLDLAGISRIQQGQLNVQGMYTSFRGRRGLHLSADLQGHERLLVVAQLLLVSQRLDLVKSADEPLMVMVDPRLADPALEELLAQAPRLLFPATALASSLRAALGHLPLDWIEQALDDPQFRAELGRVWSSGPAAEAAVPSELPTAGLAEAELAEQTPEQASEVDHQPAAAEVADAVDVAPLETPHSAAPSEPLAVVDAADPVDAPVQTEQLNAEAETSVAPAAPEPTSRRRRS